MDGGRTKNKLCKYIYFNHYKVIGQNLCLMVITRGNIIDIYKEEIESLRI